MHERKMPHSRGVACRWDILSVNVPQSHYRGTDGRRSRSGAGSGTGRQEIPAIPAHRSQDWQRDCVQTEHITIIIIYLGIYFNSTLYCYS